MEVSKKPLVFFATLREGAKALVVGLVRLGMDAVDYSSIAAKLV